MTLGHLKIEEFLQKTEGKVRGRQLSDAKDRYYAAEYKWEADGPDYIQVSRCTGRSESVRIPRVIPLDGSLVSFFGLYSGDGAKGSEDPSNPGRLRTSISFSQREPNLVRFAIDQFRKVFPGTVRFVFSLGEDSAYFMAGPGREMLEAFYEGAIPETVALESLRSSNDAADERYLREIRHHQDDASDDLAFYYQHRSAMAKILASVKLADLESAGVNLGPDDRVVASLRRPFKKGAREAGGSSRSDEMHVGGVAGLGELFLKIMHEIEGSILDDERVSGQGLVEWINTPSEIGPLLDIKEFFLHHNYGVLNGKRPSFEEAPPTLFKEAGPKFIKGRWPRSSDVLVRKTLRITPLWSYTSGLYLAEGTTPKSKMFSMFSGAVSNLGLSFTSSENASLELMLRVLGSLFRSDDCVNTWKVKVGSQYFPELVVVGLKNGVPLLRGGNSGDGKLRTMEVSLAIKEWALALAPAMEPYSGRYSHVEPTGAGVPRLDFSASSALCKWYFPLLMYATFGEIVSNPAAEFTNG